MLLLADENFPRPTVQALRDDHHDVAWVRTDAPGANDSAILDRAEVEERLIPTLDKDFWQIALQRTNPISRCGVMLFRIHPALAERLTPLARRALKGAGEAWRGKITVVTMDGIHLLPSRGSVTPTS
jgi:predicted nuclease of predicted toxin-antitoxin system